MQDAFDQMYVYLTSSARLRKLKELSRELAASDTAWNDTHTHEDVPFRVYHMDPDVFTSWTRVSDHHPPNLCTGILHCDRLLRMKDEVVARPLMSKPELVTKGEMVAKYDALMRLASEAKKANKMPEKPSKIGFSHEQETSAQSSALAASKSHVNQAKIQEVHQELQLALERKEALDHAEENDQTPADQQLLQANTSQNRVPSSLLSSSILSSVRVGSSISSKLDVVLDEV